MNTMQLSTASLDDIVFEGRNQSYGAYVLRRIYNRHLITGLIGAFMLCLLLVGTPLLVQHFSPTVTIAPGPVILPPPIELLPDPTNVAKPTKAVEPAHVQPVVITPTVAAIPTEVVKDELLKPQSLVPETPIDIEPGLLAGSVPTGTDIGIGTGKVTIPGSDSGKAAAATTTTPFVHVEMMPEFVGGADAMRQYMQRNLHYPRQALASAISGKVYVSFTVQASGEISDVQILKGLGYGTDEEAARVVKAMPTWTPGRQNSHPVSVRYTLPITFSYQ